MWRKGKASFGVPIPTLLSVLLNLQTDWRQNDPKISCFAAVQQELLSAPHCSLLNDLFLYLEALN